MGKSSTNNTWKLQLSYYKKWQLGPPRSPNEVASTNHFHPTYLSLTLFPFFKQKTSPRRGTSNLIRRIIRLRWSIRPRPRSGGRRVLVSLSIGGTEEGREGGRKRRNCPPLSLPLSHSASETAKKQNVKRAAWIKRRREARRGKGYTTTRRLLPFCGTAVAWHGRQAGRQHKRSQISFSLTRHDSIITGGAAAGAGGRRRRKRYAAKNVGKKCKPCHHPARSLARQCKVTGGRTTDAAADTDWATIYPQFPLLLTHHPYARCHDVFDVGRVGGAAFGSPHILLLDTSTLPSLSLIKLSEA